MILRLFFVSARATLAKHASIFIFLAIYFRQISDSIIPQRITDRPKIVCDTSFFFPSSHPITDHRQNKDSSWFLSVRWSPVVPWKQRRWRKTSPTINQRRWRLRWSPQRSWRLRRSCRSHSSPTRSRRRCGIHRSHWRLPFPPLILPPLIIQAKYWLILSMTKNGNML